MHEEDIVKALNNFASALGTPAWTRTTQAEVRKLRMRLLVVLPQLFAAQEPPGANGNRRLLNPGLSPLEASYIALTMLNMKVFHSGFQFTDAEQAQNQKLDPASVSAIHLQRTKLLMDIVNGRSNAVSVRDLLAAGDHLLSDLRIYDGTNSARKMPPAKERLAGTKGGLRCAGAL